MAGCRRPRPRYRRDDAGHQGGNRDRGGEAAVRVVIAEDSIFRNSIAEMLSAGGHEVACIARTGDELLTYLNCSGPPDVAVLDIRMPPTGTDEGLAAAEQIRARWPEAGILLFSAYLLLPMAERLLDLGGDGG